MASLRRRGALALLLVLSLLVAAACTGGDGGRAADEEISSDPGVEGPTEIPDGAGLTEDGVALAGDLADQAPRYLLTATVDPSTGELQGMVDADLPVGEADSALLRFFPALVDETAHIEDVRVDDRPVDFSLDGSRLVVPLGGGRSDAGGGRVRLAATFGYEVPELAASSPLTDLSSLGDNLQPAEIGLLARGDGVVTLGHWFPVWVPEGAEVEPVPDGFGDIGNFPAAVIQAEVTVPEGWTIVSGGVRTDGGDGGQVVEAAAGLRDLGMVLVEDAQAVEVPVGTTTVRVAAAGQTEADRALLDEVAREATTSLEVLAGRFGPYPWTELDVVSTPLGRGVGGMEWPGMVWIENGIFAGGLPGLGDVDLDELGGLGEVLGDLGGLGSLLDPEVLGATRAWTVAHEVGHEWWHAVVGNDSMLAPTVDEPLAQYSACIVFQSAWAETADKICEANTAGGYEQMRMLGEEDTAAAQPSDAFESSVQYGGVVYGKAPGLYDALAERFGEDAVVTALAAVVRNHAFELISLEELQAALAAELGDPAAVEGLWTRWMEQAHGDEDLGVDPEDAGGLGGLDLGDLGDLDLGDLDLGSLAELLEQLLSGG